MLQKLTLLLLISIMVISCSPSESELKLQNTYNLISNLKDKLIGEKLESDEFKKVLLITYSFELNKLMTKQAISEKRFQFIYENITLDYEDLVAINSDFDSKTITGFYFTRYLKESNNLESSNILKPITIFEFISEKLTSQGYKIKEIKHRSFDHFYKFSISSDNSFDLLMGYSDTKFQYAFGKS